MSRASRDRLLADYRSYNRLSRKRGANMARFECPKCKKRLFCMRPPRGDTWDSATTCPYCEVLFFKVVRHAGIVKRAIMDGGK